MPDRKSGDLSLRSSTGRISFIWETLIICKALDLSRQLFHLKTPACPPSFEWKIKMLESGDGRPWALLLWKRLRSFD